MTAQDAATWPLARRAWRDWVQPHRRRLVLALVLMGVVAATTGAYPLLIERSYAMFQADEPALLLLVPGAIVLLTMVKAAAYYAQVVVTGAVVQRIVTDIRIAMFRHLVAMDMASLQAAPAGALTARFITDIDRIRQALNRVVTGLVRDALTVIALVAAMIYLDWAMALFFLAFLPLMAIPIVNIGRHMRRVSRETQAQAGGMTALLTESLAGARMVKAYGLESYERRRAAQSFEENRRLSMAAVRRRSSLDPLLEAFGGLSVAGVLAFAGWRIASGHGSVGEFSGFIGALLIAAQPVRAVGTLNSALQEGLAAAQRVFELLDTAPAVADRAGAVELRRGPGALRLENVGFRYAAAERDTLTGITLEVAPGETVALVGRSGAGKSTVFNLIPRLYDVTDGRVLVDGQDVRDVTLASLRGAVAVVSQDAVLFDDTIRANIALGRPGAGDTEIEAAARAAAAHDFIARLPEGYDTPVGERGGRLSGGERQRVALARAFLKDAPILLLDEATSALDAESERLVQEALERLAAGRTTLVIAHRLATVRNADRIVVMEDGRIVEQGPPDTLLAAEGAYARFSRLQAPESAASR